MKYPNAYRGVKKFFSSDVFALITIVCLLLALIPPLGLPLMIVAGCLSIVSYVLLVVGICQAAKDEPTFLQARTAVIIALVCSLLRLFIDEGNLLYSIISLIESIASLCCSVFVIRGIIELARSLKNLRMSERGRKLIRLILILTICAFVLRLIVSILTVSQTALVLAFILLLAYSAFSIAVSIKKLSYLNEATTMLCSGTSEPGVPG